MLDFYFTSVVRRRQLRRGPLAADLDELAAEFQQERYATTTARRLLSIIGQFSGYLGLCGLAVDDIDERVVERFLDAAFVPDGLCVEGPRALRYLLGYLRRHGIIAQAKPPAPHPFARTLEGFDRYLRDVRGLATSTRHQSVTLARSLIDWLSQRYDRDELLAHFTGSDVLDFITERLSRYPSRSGRAHLTSNMRGFLRYLQACGLIATDLARTVPRVSTPRLATLPRALPWEQVRMLIDGIDTTHPDGMRDKAILLTLATLGLRSGELKTLELSEIHWRSGEIRLVRTKNRRERRLPLLHELGVALADYVLHGRPSVALPQLFLCHGRQPTPLKANTIIWIIRRHLQRAGLSGARCGAHTLRHSLASRMVNVGVSIKSVADVLGHASIDTTAIYTKVDTTTLATVALPFPGGVQ